MLVKLANQVLRALSSTESRKPSVASKPALEALEGRSLPDANAFVQSLYSNVLQRTPTDAEVNSWVREIQSGVSLQSVSAAFVGSSEHLGLIVQSEYTSLLGRNADQQSLNYWIQQMTAGMTQDQMAATIASSQEFSMVHGSTNQDFINGVYETVLHRSPSDTELTYWNNQLMVSLSRQATRQGVAARIVGSDEAHLFDVTTIYSEILHRNPDSSGEAYWSNFMDNGGTESQVAEGLINSTEYLTATGVSQPNN